MGICFSCFCGRSALSVPPVSIRPSRRPAEPLVLSETVPSEREPLICTPSEGLTPARRPARSLFPSIEEVPRRTDCWDTIYSPPDDSILKPYIDYAEAMGKKRFLSGHWAFALASLQITWPDVF